MKNKKGVIAWPLHPAMRKVKVEAGRVWEEFGQKCVITSGLEGEHGDGSLHPFGCALDFRTRFFKKGVPETVAKKLKKRLGPDYVVICHGKHHIHVGYNKILEIWNYEHMAQILQLL